LTRPWPPWPRSRSRSASSAASIAPSATCRAPASCTPRQFPDVSWFRRGRRAG
jgi:hypothetical protein